MIALYLTRVHSDKIASAIKATKSALVAAGMVNNMETLDKAEIAVYTVLRTGKPRGLVVEDPSIAVTAQQVIDAAKAFEANVGDSDAAEARTIDLSHENVEAPEPEAQNKPADSQEATIAQAFMADTPDDFQPTRAGATTAAVIMGMCDGNAQSAFLYARRLASTTGNPELWIEVAHILGAAYGFKAVAVHGV